MIWLSPDVLLIAGFSNAKDAGMLALLDAGMADGQSPPVEGGDRFRCTSCGTEAPARYVVLPRSELNLVTGSPFNRARIELTSDRIIASTVEIPSTGAEATVAVYEFSRALDLLRASFGDRYWEIHRALEVEGKIKHTRQQCPERDGPRAIEVWEKATGWTTRPVTR